MTIDREDPERENPAGAEQPAAGLRGFESRDGGLVAWAIGAVGAALLQEGLSRSDLLIVAKESFRSYARCRETVPDPRAYLVDQMLRRARERMRLRGIAPRPGSRARVPHLLELIAMKEGMATLTDAGRKALHLIYVDRKRLEAVAADFGASVEYVQLLGETAVEQLWDWWWQHGRES